jgi:hypothetical protein
MSFMADKNKGKTSSSNSAHGDIKNAFGGMMNSGGGASSALMNMLGLGGGGASMFDAYRDSSNYDFVRDQGTQAITSNAAAKGLLGSGGTMKALSNYGQQTADSFAGNYMDRLMGVGDQALRAGGLVAETANKTGTSSSSKKPGLGSLLGSAATAISMSDMRLKTDIVKVGEAAPGLGIYDYTYTTNGHKSRGVMAHEVAELYPEALGPVIDGYQSVDYGKLIDILEGK